MKDPYPNPKANRHGRIRSGTVKRRVYEARELAREERRVRKAMR